MAILLKEISLNYSENDIKKLFWDYFAMYDLWRKVGSGHPTDVQTHRRMEIIDDLFDLVQDRFVSKILAGLMRAGINLKESTDDEEWGLLGDKLSTQTTKLARRLMSARALKDREEIHSIIVDLTSIGNGQGMIDGVDREDIRSQRRVSINNPVAYLQRVSPLVAKIFKSNLHFFVGSDKAKSANTDPLKAEPIAKPASDPNWLTTFANNALQKPAPEAPKAPVAPPIVPPAPEKPMDQPMNGNNLKRLIGNWESILKSHGFEWDEINKVYEKGNGEAWISVYNNNTSTLILKGGERKNFDNLGLLFRHLNHEKQKQFAPTGAPTAQLNETHFKDLFRFLYS